MDTTSEEYRAACEARWIMSKPKAEREAYYALVAKHRGRDAMLALKASVMEEWRKRPCALTPA